MRVKNGDMLCVYLVPYDDRLFDLCPQKGNSHLPTPVNKDRACERPVCFIGFQSEIGRDTRQIQKETK